MSKEKTLVIKGMHVRETTFKNGASGFKVGVVDDTSTWFNVNLAQAPEFDKGDTISFEFEQKTFQGRKNNQILSKTLKLVSKAEAVKPKPARKDDGEHFPGPTIGMALNNASHFLAQKGESLTAGALVSLAKELLQATAELETLKRSDFTESSDEDGPEEEAESDDLDDDLDDM